MCWNSQAVYNLADLDQFSLQSLQNYQALKSSIPSLNAEQLDKTIFQRRILFWEYFIINYALKGKSYYRNLFPFKIHGNMSYTFYDTNIYWEPNTYEVLYWELNQDLTS